MAITVVAVVVGPALSANLSNTVNAWSVRPFIQYRFVIRDTPNLLYQSNLIWSCNAQNNNE